METKNIMTDVEVKLTGYLSEKKYPKSFRLVLYYDEEMTVNSLFQQMRNNFLHWMSPIFIKKRLI